MSSVLKYSPWEKGNIKKKNKKNSITSSVDDLYYLHLQNIRENAYKTVREKIFVPYHNESIFLLFQLWS